MADSHNPIGWTYAVVSTDEEGLELRRCYTTRIAAQRYADTITGAEAHVIQVPHFHQVTLH